MITGNDLDQVLMDIDLIQIFVSGLSKQYTCSRTVFQQEQVLFRRGNDS